MVKLVEPKLLKASDFLLRWRAEYKKPELTGKGYGMIAGKVADPNDPYHQYMLNAYAYLESVASPKCSRMWMVASRRD